MPQPLTPRADLPSPTEGDDYTYAVSFTDHSGAPIDLTGWTVSMTIAEQGAAGTPLVERDITTHDDATGGMTSWSVSAADTAGLSGTKRYDIQVVKADGTTRTIGIGTIGFVDGVTDRDVAGGGGSSAGATAGASIDVTLGDDDAVAINVRGLTSYTDSDAVGALDGATVTPAQVGTADNPTDAVHSKVGQLGEVSVSQSASYDGSPIGLAVDKDSAGDLTEHIGQRVTVPGASPHTIFSVTEPVDVLNGVVIGSHTRQIEVGWGDGTVDTIYGGISQGADSASDYLSPTPIPQLVGVAELVFYNAAGGNKEYGYKVLTK